MTEEAKELLKDFQEVYNVAVQEFGKSTKGYPQELIDRGIQVSRSKPSINIYPIKDCDREALKELEALGHITNIRYTPNQNIGFDFA
jgi:hypothetical protein